MCVYINIYIIHTFFFHTHTCCIIASTLFFEWTPPPSPPSLAPPTPPLPALPLLSSPSGSVAAVASASSSLAVASA